MYVNMDPKIVLSEISSFRLRKVAEFPNILSPTVVSYTVQYNYQNRKLILVAYYYLNEIRSSPLCVCVCVCSTRVWTQGLHLEPLHQPFFMMGFFKIESRKLFAWGYLWTAILLICASWIPRITSVSQECPAVFLFLMPCFCSFRIWSGPTFHSCFALTSPSLHAAFHPSFLIL
jgi:hypothetical protein